MRSKADPYSAVCADLGLVSTIARLLLLLWVLPAAAGPQEAVLVTGASSGIGRSITERLASDGYFVFATARKDSDLQALGAIKNVQAIRLDVTKADEIAAAVQIVSQAGRGLYGLVNNAGLTSYGSVMKVDPKEYDQVMAVNVTGPFRMAKAFAPLITAKKGRIVNISSILGIASVEDMSMYCMSKHALESFTDTFALEMEPLGVKVNAVEPGAYKTAINANFFARAGEPEPADWRDAMNTLKAPDEVAKAVEHALFEPNPKRRYMVVPDAAQYALVVDSQVRELAEVNEGQVYSYDRKLLIQKLDGALANARPRKK